MSNVPSSECLECIIDALDIIACRAVTVEYANEVAAQKHRVRKVLIRAELILGLIKEKEEKPGLRLIKT